jgi:hypothetical protein
MHTRAHSLVVVAVVAAVVAAPTAGIAPATAAATTHASADATDLPSVDDHPDSTGQGSAPAGSLFALDEHDEDDGDGDSGAGNESVAGNESSGNESVAGNESSGNETRAPRPNVGSAAVTVLRTPSVVGEPLVVAATTTNNGTEAGRKVVQFEIGDEVVDSREFVLEPGESRTETFVYTFETPGNHSFEVDAGRNRFVAVEPKRPALDVLSVGASPASLSSGGDVTVTALVKNDGEANGTVSVPLELFGDVVTVREVTLSAGETTEVTFTRTVREPGSYDAVVGDRSAAFEVTADSQPRTTAEDPVVESASETPGFGPLVAVAGGVVAVALLLWRRD